MTEQKFTQGGWSRNVKPASHYPVIFAGRNTHVAVVSTRGLSEEEIEANCDLIAAAPDLYKAVLKCGRFHKLQARHDCLREKDQHKEADALLPDLAELDAYVDAALRKARGETP